MKLGGYSAELNAVIDSCLTRNLYKRPFSENLVEKPWIKDSVDPKVLGNPVADFPLNASVEQNCQDNLARENNVFDKHSRKDERQVSDIAENEVRNSLLKFSAQLNPDSSCNS